MMFPLPYAIAAILAPATITLASAAAPWSLPEPTGRFAVAIDNWSPVTTPAPRIRHALFAREANNNTCGYVSGLAESSITCPNPSDACATNTYYGILGCCNPASLSKCTIPISCIPSSALPTCSGSSCTADPATISCTASSAPECFLQSIVYASTTMLQRGCAATGYTRTAYRSPGLPSTSQPSDQRYTVTVTSGSDPTAAPTTASSSSSKNHLGPIIGGTVAGCVVLACILFTCFIIRRRRTRSQSASHPQPLDQHAHPDSPHPTYISSNPSPGTHPASPAMTAVEAPSPGPLHGFSEYNPNGFTGYAHPQDAKGWAPSGGVWRPEVQRYAVEVDGADGRVEVPG